LFGYKIIPIGKRPKAGIPIKSEKIFENLKDINVSYIVFKSGDGVQQECNAGENRYMEFSAQVLQELNAKGKTVDNYFSKPEVQQELGAITSAKKLAEYIFAITKSAPKQYRWNIIDKVLNTCLDLVKLLYKTNDMSDKKEKEAMQHEVDTLLKYASWLVNIGQTNQVFTNQQVQHIGKLILETRKKLWAWIRGSDSS